VKLAVIVALMFGFGYALVPLYKAICEALGINVLSLSERQVPGARAWPTATPRSTTAAPSRWSSTPMRGPGTSSRRCA
jgi:cytochrome c oxidase assembly protein subunit 11